ncbi:NADH-quinone oxidoreductase subunit G [Mycobacterium sp. HM-7]
MTVTEPAKDATAVEMVSLTIDDQQISVPKGTLVIRAAELIGVQIPRFCDHPLLDPVGACRQCLVEVEGQRKPLASCTTTVSPDMVVRTQVTSEAADKAQHGVMELLLINHPLDCPVCDKGGECPLQNQAMSNGRSDSRFEDVKRTYPKPINLSAQVLLDRERCVLCARCTRFSDQVAGDPFIELLERGALQQVGIGAGPDGGKPFDSYFSGNTVQICPVGALTGTAYRFRARPFDLVSSPSVCEHCASGCAQRTDHRRGTVLRRLAGDDPDVNEEWNCDKGRWAFTYATQGDRITTPLIREADGTQRPASWPEAVAVAVRGLSAAGARTGVLVGGRLTTEDAYAYAKYARIVLGTNDIDFRNRVHSHEEAQFLAATIAGQPMRVTYADLEKAPVVLLVAFEPEDESPIVYLRLRKAFRKRGLKVVAVAPFASRGLEKMGGTLIAAAPGREPRALDAIEVLPPGSVILTGERLAGVPGGFSAVARLAERTGADVGWVPRRAGERGALEAGAAPNLLPGGRLVTDLPSRTEVAVAWHVDELPDVPGRDTTAILTAAAAGDLDAVLVAGVELADLPDPELARQSLSAAKFVVSMEVRRSAVTDLAHVVFPVSPVVEKTGSFVNWEGRQRTFGAALAPATRADMGVLAALADEHCIDLGLRDVATVRNEMSRLGCWTGPRPAAPEFTAPPNPVPGPGQAILAGWRMLLDAGRLQDGEPNLAATARPAVARLSPETAAGIGASESLTVSTDLGSITLPLEITDMPAGVVWLPLNSPGSTVHATLGVAPGAVVSISGAGS